ncbi:MAG TPA: FAD-dependent oxidoreductase [Virgibacillus sp.]|nr:FAD-dependent oxidoreductase [Virgibacillus sp.]HLR68021.1 FAD-dependent oxidoreductase [Virgibacillus sp.]
MTKYQLPKHPESYWRENMNIPDFPPLDKDIEVDVVIVGGGITGITSAYLLANEGMKVALLEADKVLGGTTGHTTAKITAQHGLIYDELIKSLGKNKARLYYEANRDALNFIEKTIHQHQINCDFRRQDAYLYAENEEYARKIKQEAKAYEKLGIDGEIVDKLPLDIIIRNALIMRNQAQFHPLKYLSHLVQHFTDKGGHIFEGTTAVNVESEKEKPVVQTRENKRVTASYVLACSHFPFYEGMGFYSTRMYANRSYIVAAKTKKSFPGGMYISAGQPTRSLRSVTINGEEMVLIVGESHKTGQGGNTMKHYEALASFGEYVLGMEEIPYRWSAQDLTTLDKVPYVGEITSHQPKILIATGYRKWGMSNGTAAALLLRDQVLDKENHYHALFTPARFHVHPSLKNFFTQNADVATHLIKGKLDITDTNPKNLANDEGAVFRMNGERKGAYRDDKGELHIVDTTCTHVGCEVEWNEGEKTWDCPCHGSRFSYTGEVMEGPAEKPLQTYDFKMLDIATSEDSGY